MDVVFKKKPESKKNLISWTAPVNRFGFWNQQIMNGNVVLFLIPNR